LIITTCRNLNCKKATSITSLPRAGIPLPPNAEQQKRTLLHRYVQGMHKQVIHSSSSASSNHFTKGSSAFTNVCLQIARAHDFRSSYGLQPMTTSAGANSLAKKKAQRHFSRKNSTLRVQIWTGMPS